MPSCHVEENVFSSWKDRVLQSGTAFFPTDVLTFCEQLDVKLGSEGLLQSNFPLSFHGVITSEEGVETFRDHSS